MLVNLFFKDMMFVSVVPKELPESIIPCERCESNGAIVKSLFFPQTNCDRI